MEVARKDYYQLQQELQQEQMQEPKKKKKIQKSYRLEKVMATVGIMLVLVLSLSLLLRYASITELRHQVHRLNTHLEQAEKQKEKLKIEMEKVSKSRVIEETAKERLGMQYPGKEDIFYIAIDPTKVDLMNNEINRRFNPIDEIEAVNNPRGISKVIQKISGMFNI